VSPDGKKLVWSEPLQWLAAAPWRMTMDRRERRLCASARRRRLSAIVHADLTGYVRELHPGQQQHLHNGADAQRVARPCHGHATRAPWSGNCACIYPADGTNGRPTDHSL
jgi:hypothetical protein